MPTILYDTGTCTRKVRGHRPVCEESPWHRNRDSRLLEIKSLGTTTLCS
jgi:hypothetical protein